jgi:nucleotide-binding universal stress UspA family protein
MKTILAAIDFSTVSQQVVAHASRLAQALHARVILLTALVPPVFVKEFAPQPESLARVLAGTENAAPRKLAAIQQRLASKSVPEKVVLWTGDPVRLIVEKAAEHRASYIIMGSHGHTALYDLVAGSTTHRVLQRAACPVVIIPSREIRAGKPRAGT